MAQESVLRIVIDSRNAERNARALASELDSIEKKGDFASKSMDSMSVATRQLAGYMVGVVTVGAAIGKMDTYTGIQNQLKLVTDSQAELNSAMKETFAIAQRSRSSWESVTTVYQKLAMNAKEIGLAQSDISKLTETVSKGIALSGSSAEGAASAITQLGQALGNGQLRGDEFNAVMENGYGLMRLLAEGMGVPIGQLKAMAEAGELTSEKVTKALLSMSSTADAEFAKTDATIKQSISELGNAITKFTGEAGKASGVATTLASSIQILANNLDAIAGIAVVGGVALLTKTILAQTVAIQSSISAVVARRAADTAALQSQIQLTAVEVQRTRQVAALALTEINLARQELNSATTRQARAAATMRLTQAEVAHNIALKQSAAAVATQVTAEANLAATRTAGARALALVGGPIGAITIGVTALAAGYMLLSDNSEKSTKSLRDNNEAVGDAIVKYRELNSIQRDAQMAAERQKLDDLNEAYRKASAELMVYASNMSNLGEVVTESQVELSKLFAEYKKTGDLNAFNTAVQNSSKVSQDAKDKTANFAKAVFEAGAASKTQKEFIAQLSGELNGTANAGNSAAAGVRNLASALTEINTKLSADVFSAKLQNAFEKQGKSAQSASRWTEVYNENAKKGFKGVTIEQKKMLDQLDAVDKQRDARQKAAQASASALTKASKAALTQQKKEAKEANRIDEEQRNLREQYIYAYADREKQIELNLAKEVAEIQKANFANPEPYLEAANKRAYYEKQIYLSQLQFEINEFQMSEEQKLKYSYDIKNLQLHQNSEITKESKEIAINALEEQYNQELSYIKLAKEQRIFQVEQTMYSEMELIQKRYAFELQEIAKVQDADERSRLLNAASFNKKESENDLTKSLTSDYMNVMGFEENPLIQQFEVLNKLRENDLINEEAYQNAKLQLQAKSTAGYMEGMLGGFASLVDENSKTYAVLFAAQKAFAVAQAMLNIPAAYSKAYDAVVGTPYIGPYIAPAVGAAAAALQVAQAANIKSTTMPGFKSGGYTGNYGTSEVAGVVHGQEYVLNAEATKRVGINTLNAINNGGTIQAEKVAQANAKVSSGNSPNINLNPNFVIVDERESMSDYLFSPDGTKAFVKFFKRNKAALGV
ncbi:MAG: tape measure protein [Acinetobacter johnsonii]|nr:tape measure protein [Acinetobacter johnsonii]